MDFKLLTSYLLDEVNDMIKESKIVSEDYLESEEISDEDYVEMEAEEKMDDIITQIGIEFGKMDKESLSDEEFVLKAKEILNKYDYPYSENYGIDELSRLYDLIVINDIVDESTDVEVSVHDVDATNIGEIVDYLIDYWNMEPENLAALDNKTVREIFNTIKKLTAPKSVEESMEDYVDSKSDITDSIKNLVEVFGMDKDYLMKKTDDEIIGMSKIITNLPNLRK